MIKNTNLVNGGAVPNVERTAAIALDRRQFVGGSDARVIMGKDEKALHRLWREKRGEIAALDQDGRSSFQLLLQRELGWVQGFVEGTVSVQEASGVSTTATICAEASNFAQPRGPVSTTVKASSDKSSTRDAKAPRTDS